MKTHEAVSAKTPPAGAATREALLDTAQMLAQQYGYGGFSFHDLAARTGIKTASVHYHFRSKEDLGRELMARYRRQFIEALARAEPATGSLGRLRHLTALFERTLAQDSRLCLCGALASDYASLPAAVRAEVLAFYRDVEQWLAGVLADGRGAGALTFEGSAPATARVFFSALEGAMIAARAFGEPQRLRTAGRHLIAGLRGRSASPRVQEADGRTR